MDDEESISGPHNLDPTNCLILLRSQSVGRIIVSGADPYVALVNYAVIEGGVVYRSDGGSHLAELEGERVAFEVDCVVTAERMGWSVVARGFVTDVTESLTADLEPPNLSSWAPGPKECWMRIRIDEVTGRWVHKDDRPSEADDRGYL